MRLGFWPAVYGNWIISTHPETCDASFASTKRATLLAERLGFETLLIAEHFMNPVEPGLDQLDAWSTASALAAVTDKIEIITAVKPGFRAPGVIAKMASNIDHISHGRMAINLVSAWWLTEFEMLGAPILPHDERYARSEEFLTIIKGSWTHERYSFAGHYYQVKETSLSPQARPTAASAHLCRGRIGTRPAAGGENGRHFSDQRPAGRTHRGHHRARSRAGRGIRPTAPFRHVGVCDLS